MKTISKIATIILMCFALSSASAQVSVGISVRLAPPALPVYVQPECPVDGYIWQPGYWAYDDADGYYWVPGVWVAPPQPEVYWTPAYWGYDGGVYGFHSGYWGPHVGFYGGINYGYGYSGYGYGGGRWVGNRFSYNTAVVHINRTVIHNTYVDRTVIHNSYGSSRASFNGGRGGVQARPRPEEQRAMSERHFQPTHEQVSHQQAAGKERSQFANVNHGKPGAASLDKVSGRPFNVRGSHVAHSTGFGNKPNSPATPNRPESHGQPQQHQQPAKTGDARPQMHVIPHERPAGQQPEHHEQVRPQPQQHAEQPRPQPQQHMQQPRPQPQQHMQQPRPQPQQHVEQPRPQPQQQHMQPQRSAPHSSPRPMGGGHHH